VLGGELAHPLQVAGVGRHDTDVELDRLDEDRGDLAGVRLEDGLERIGVVVRRHHRLRQAAERDARRGRHGVRSVVGPIASRGGWMLTSTSSWWP
jgi:hypothetical protein